MSQFKYFARQLSVMGILQILIRLRGLLVLPIITKMLGTVEYAVWTQFTVTVEFAFPLISLGLTGALLRFLPSEKDRLNLRDGLFSILTFVLIVGAIVGLCFVIFAGPLSRLFFDGDVVAVRILSVAILTNALSIFLLTYFRTFKQTITYSIFYLTENIAGLLLILILAHFGFDIHFILASLVAIKCLQIISLLALIIKQVGFSTPHFRRFREFLKYSFPSVPANISGWAVRLSDRYTISFFLGIAAVAYYSPAYTLGNFIIVLIEPFSLIITPYLAQNFDSNKIDNVKTFLRFTIKYYLLLAIPASVALSVLSKPLLTYLSNPEIAQHAYVITPFVAASILVYGVIVLVSEVILLVKKTKLIAYAWIWSALVNIILNIIFIPRYGLIVAAITTLLSYVFVFIVLLKHASRYLSIPFGFRSIVKTIFCSMIMGLVLYALPTNSLSDIFINCSICLLVYVTLTFITKTFSTTEIRFILSLLPKKT